MKETFVFYQNTPWHLLLDVFLESPSTIDDPVMQQDVLKQRCSNYPIS